MYCVSIHYADMADPSRFTRQMKRESQLSLAEPRKATIKRHATSMAFSVKVKEGAESPTKRVQSAKMFTTTPRAQSQPHFTAAAVNTDEHDGMITLSELDSCVSALEIVQLQLDKQSECSSLNYMYLYMHVRVCTVIIVNDTCIYSSSNFDTVGWTSQWLCCGLWDQHNEGRGTGWNQEKD